MKKILLASALMIHQINSNAQDVHFTQYTPSITLNPAITGTYIGNQRLFTAVKQQQNEGLNNNKTFVLQAESKFLHKKDSAANGINLGIAVISDKFLDGIVKGNYVMASVSHHVNLEADGRQTLGLGFSAGYGNRRVNLSGISFENQFQVDAFNMNLPSGENVLSNLKSYLSVGAGAIYRYQNRLKQTSAEIGLAAFHLNKPKQSFLKDDLQTIPLRFSAQAAIKKGFDNDVSLTFTNIFQSQAGMQYFQTGLAFSHLLGDKKDYALGIGAFYSTNSIWSGIITTQIKKFDIGISYGSSFKAQYQAAYLSNMLELSLMTRL